MDATNPQKISVESSEVTYLRRTRCLSFGLETAKTRLAVVALLFGLAFLAIGVRLFDLMVLDYTGPMHQRAAQSAAVNSSQATTAHSKKSSGTGIIQARGDIIDRNGRLLATTLKTASLYADPKFVMNPMEAAQKLAKALPGLEPSELVKRLSSPGRFVWIKRHLTPRQQYQVNTLGIPGVYFKEDSRRFYPHGRLTSHVLGYTDIDNRGIAGLEKFFEEDLVQGDQSLLQLSLDVRVQEILHQELTQAVKKHEAIGAAGVVLDVKTGEIVAMVSLPDFDPQMRRNVSQDALFNRASLGVYEMGSTFKIFTAAMALEQKTAKFADRYNTRDPVRLAGGFAITDFRYHGSRLSFPEIFMHSSNIGAARIMQQVDLADQQSFFEQVNFMAPSGIELPERGQPILPARWSDVTAQTLSFGYGLAVTPLHLANAVATTVNGGAWRPLTLVKGKENEAMRVISEQTSRDIRRLMHLTVNQGTGGKAANTGYLIGGKTGTAKKSSAGGYEDAVLSSFVGAFPIHDPEYVVLAVLDEPQGTEDTYGFATGGWTAAPVVRKVVERMAPLMRLKPFHQLSPEIKTALHIDEALRSKQVAGF